MPELFRVSLCASNLCCRIRCSSIYWLVVRVKGRHGAGFGAQLQSLGGSRCEMELWGQHRGATALSGTVGSQCFRCTSGKPSEKGCKASSFLLASHMGAPS